MLIVYKIWPKSTNQFTLEDKASPPLKFRKSLANVPLLNFPGLPNFTGGGGWWGDCLRCLTGYGGNIFCKNV